MTVEGLQLLNNMGAIQALLCFFVFCFGRKDGGGDILNGGGGGAQFAQQMT